jgi:hypothetical protein
MTRRASRWGVVPENHIRGTPSFDHLVGAGEQRMNVNGCLLPL